MKRIQFALVAVMLCATVSACKRDEPPAPAPMPAATDDVPQSGGDKVGTKPVPAAAEDDDAPQSGGDKVGG